MGAQRQQRDGPREAVRWIGDAFVLEGNLETGAPAVWRGRRSTCARVRIVHVTAEAHAQPTVEHGVDELVVTDVSGPTIIPRLATYQSGEVLAIVDEDVGDVSLRDLIVALARESGDAPVGLALHVARACARAWQSAEQEFVVDADPARIVLGWDGAVWLCAHPAGADDDAYAPPGVYRVGVGREQRSIGVLLHELLTGAHPSLRLPLPETVTPALRDVVAQLLTDFPRFVSWDACVDRLDALSALEPFAAADLAAMLRALFDERRVDAEREREDRLGVLPGPRVEHEAWTLLDGDTSIDDVGDVGFVRLADAPSEPNVHPRDPFEDQERDS